MSMTKTGLPLDLSAPVAEDTPSWVTDFAGNARKVNQFAQEKNEQIDKVGASQADKYSTATTYAVGDYCIYEDELYKCETEITAPEEWDASKWKKTNISAEIGSLQAKISVLEEKTGLLGSNISKKIITGSNTDAMIVVTEQTLAFSDGIASVDCASIANAYGKTINNAIVQIESAVSTVITSSIVDKNIITAKAYNIGVGAVLTGSIKCMCTLFLY